MLPWNNIETVLLDMDGTLLDLNFDNHFWQEFVPCRYAEKHGISAVTARSQLEPRFKAMEGTLEWYCLDYWSNDLQLDIAGLKVELAGLIVIMPHVTDFLLKLRQSQSARKLLLVTNAHRDSLGLKMEKTCLHAYFDEIISSHDFGAPKEHVEFWRKLQQRFTFQPEKSLLVDDSLSVLSSARQFGIQYLVTISQPDSTREKRNVLEYPAIADFRELMPGL